ncbi:MAG TPA: shikimate dehydrogenase [Casimicrobiaceae bacterium]|nr:shikimate dehydrogenase [Casimicrobiaceae bacterium]
MTDLYAVIGNPIAQSKSPRIHAAFARQLRQDLRYEAILGPLGGFQGAVEGFCAQGGRGLNVTVPFKLDAFALATERTERAEQAGAVNTLKFEGAGVVGDNTDGAGLIADVRGRLDVMLQGTRILLMGAGGAARGVLLPLLREGPVSITIANRTVDRATALARRFHPFGPVEGGDYARLAGRSFDVVINATSASLYGEVPPVPSGIFAPGALAYDMAYGSGPTAFLGFARDQGAGRLADGLGMLVAQAAESFFLWRGVRPDIEPVIAMLRAG